MYDVLTGDVSVPLSALSVLISGDGNWLDGVRGRFSVCSAGGTIVLFNALRGKGNEKYG